MGPHLHEGLQWYKSTSHTPITMKRRGYLSQTANVTPQIVYSLFYKDNISHVEQSILQQLKAQNFHKEILHGTESFKCSLNDIKSKCERMYDQML